MLQCAHMKRVVFILSFLLLSLPTFALAQDTSTTTVETTSAESTVCSCYCKSSSGAMNIGVQNSVGDCQSACGASDYSILGCYTGEQTEILPENNQLCWTEYECTTQVSSEVGTEEDAFEWSGQKSNCIAGEGYCYQPQPDITLGVVIGDLTTTKDLPTYLNAVYNWLIPAAALVAVVVIMIGGLQYALAHGDNSKIGAAKKRITGAVTGMILLMGAYAILNLIDPDLVTWNALRVPMVRQVVYLDPSSTCEVMAANGITITAAASSTECGSTGTITSVDGYTGGTTTLTVGATCIYSACSSALETCMASVSSETGYTCARCSDSYTTAIGVANEDAPAPSASTCSQLLYEPITADPDQKYYCEFQDVAFNECIELTYPSGSDYLDCEQLRQDALAGDSYGCRAYDLVQARFGNSLADATAEQLADSPNATILADLLGVSGDWVDDEVDDLETADGEYALMTAVCEDDPCGLAPSGHSCKSFVADPDELATGAATLCAVAVVATSGLALAPCVAAVGGAYLLTDELIANCAQDDSMYGLYHCLDASGAEVDCNPTW